MAYVNLQLRTRPICISLPPLSSNPFNPCNSRSICGKQQEQFAGYLCISCAKPLVLVSGLRFLETFRRHPALVFAFAALAPLPARLAIMASKIKIAFLALCCKFLAENFVKKKKINEKY